MTDSAVQVSRGPFFHRVRPHIGPVRRMRTDAVLGYNINRGTLAEAVYRIVESAQSRTSLHVAFINAHCANIARRNWRYREALNCADLLLPDGSGIAIATKLEGAARSDNLNGTDLFPPLCRSLALRQIPVFFLGGGDQVSQTAAEAAIAKYPGLRVAGTHHGFFGPHEEAAVLDKINRSGARVVFVAFGVPDQDIWIARIRHQLDAPVLLGVGGLLDFVSGRIPRAPKWMRGLGIEWLYRLRCEPGRMWKRYLIGNATFLVHAVSHAWQKRKPGFYKRLDRAASRMMDILGAGAGLALISPLLLATAIAIRLESRGPALFRQIRVGENGREFELLKFRSMRIGGPTQEDLKRSSNDRDDGVTFKLRKDPRITRIGGFIRKYSIDELPQLWNVLKGEMSLVGPRPALPAEVAKYSRSARRRLRGKPGLTCLWQISGRADLPFDRQVVLDVAYLKAQSFWLDMMILVKTPVAVLTARGAY